METKYYSYRLDHDFGLAPNPFGKFCTLSVCKPKIRKSNNLNIGDWIIGTGSKALEKTSGKKLVNNIIYAMRVTEVLPMEKYWDDSRFQDKKPIINGPLRYMYGDNFYHRNKGGEWVQEDSAHSKVDGTNEGHLKKDISGENILISDYFFYFGDKAPQIPTDIKGVCHSTQGEKLVEEEEGIKLIEWLRSQYTTGLHGDPINWVQHSQGSISFKP